MRQCAFASKQLATEFAFKVLDGTRQGRLCHVAALCSLGQIQRLADRQEVSDMVHFHSTTLATLLRINSDLLGCRRDHLSRARPSGCSLVSPALILVVYMGIINVFFQWQSGYF
jgi:hypothetical protein